MIPAVTAIRYRDVAAQPRVMVLAAYTLAYLLVWALTPLLSHWSIPDDNLEQLAWVLRPDWGYYKHPPFPTWVLWAFERVFPHSVPLTYMLGSLQVAAMLVIAWRLTVELLDQRRAIVAVLMISCMTYYTNRLHFYNHNTALLVAHAAALYCVWRCVSTGRTLWWVLLGLCWGAGMLAKYQMLIAIACNVGFLGMLAQRESWRAERIEFLKGIALAGAICIAMLTPHVLWLVRNHFPTFAYASHSMAADLPLWQRPLSIAGFLANQVWRVTPIAALAALLLRFGGPSALHPPAAAQGDRDATVRLLLHRIYAGVLLVQLLSLAWQVR